jgi:hypothetical protein
VGEQPPQLTGSLQFFTVAPAAAEGESSMQESPPNWKSGLLLATVLVACGAGEADDSPGSGGSGNPGSGGSSSVGGANNGGTPPATSGGSSAGTGTVGGSGAIAGSAGVGVGGSSGDTGGTGGTGDTGGSGGDGVGGSFVGGGSGGGPAIPELDCGGKGTAIENAGPPANRVNYVIVGDGYSAAQLETTYMQHLQVAMAKRFSDPIGQVYLRYRKFVNICALKIPSNAGISTGQSAFQCGEYRPGTDSRLAECNSQLINAAISQNLPASFEVDWRACVLNGSSWWNTGSQLMLWSGGHNEAAGAALHEGGHGFHQLADEYCTRTGSACGANMCSGNGQDYNEVNSTGNCQTTNGKWDLWLGYNQEGATGVQGTFIGSRYVDSGQYRPSSNSMMNSLFNSVANTSFNAVSREKMIMDIWRIVQRPWDSVEPPAGAVTNPTSLTVNVIDPAVISVDWSVDGNVIALNGGPTYNIAAAGLPAGTHTVTARAYDNAGTDLVRYREHTTFNRQYWGAPSASRSMAHSDQTVTWTVTIQ